MSSVELMNVRREVSVLVVLVVLVALSNVTLMEVCVRDALESDGLANMGGSLSARARISGSKSLLIANLREERDESI